jgi:hypothetical protein
MSHFEEVLAARGRIAELERKVERLEERLCYTEMARDNAQTMENEAKTKSKRVRASAGRRIAALLDHISRLQQEVPLSTRDWSRGRVAAILEDSNR